MESLKKEIQDLIIKFENGQESANKTVEKMNRISHVHIDVHFLKNYWRSTSLEDFVTFLTTSEIINWTKIDEVYASNLITEIKNNITNDDLIDKNTEALEKRYKKPEGTITNWIFYDDITDTEEIISLLKQNTTIQL